MERGSVCLERLGREEDAVAFLFVYLVTFWGAPPSFLINTGKFILIYECLALVCLVSSQLL